MKEINKLSIPATILMASIVLGSFYYLSESNKQASIERQQQIELANKAELEKSKLEQANIKQAQVDLEQQQKTKTQSSIDKCITDAYTELKTLQWNYGVISAQFCAKDASACDVAYWDKAKDDAFKTYQNEWIPQCKLGNRVFIHYEPMSF